MPPLPEPRSPAPAVAPRAALTAALAAVGAAALWGTTGTAQALGPDGTDPTSVGAVRIAVGAVVLLLLAAGARRPRGRTGWSTPPPYGVLHRLPSPALVVVGGLAVAAYQASFFLGVARAGVAVGTVVALGVAPLATGMLGLLLGERPARRWVVATAGAITGVALLVAGSAAAGSGGPDAVGVGAALGAGVSYAGYTVAARALLVRDASGVRVMAGFFTLGALCLAPWVLRSDLGWLATRDGMLMALWLGVAATGVSYVLFQRGLVGLPSSTVATLSLAEPVTATALGVLVLREEISVLAAVGMLVVLLSLSVMALPARRGRPDWRT